MEELRKGRHVVSMLHAHLVFVTKYRGKVLSRIHLDRLQEIFQSVCNDFDVSLSEFNGEKDHVHLLVEYSPKVQLSKLVNSLKGVSSRLLRKEFADIRIRYWKGVLWSPSYFVGSCGGAPIDILRRYVENQGKH
nr:IS200/IS605 family transposase [Pseudodesulfovibrio profundus]